MHKKFFKRVITLLAALSVFLLVVTGCGKTSDNSVQNIKHKGTLVVGTSADFPPMEFQIMKHGQKQYVGFDMMLAHDIAKDMGVKLKVVNIAFPSLINELQEKKVDLVMAGMTYTKKRAKVVAFSKQYHNGGNVLMVTKKNQNKYNTKSSLKNASVGAQQSSLQEKILNQQVKEAKPVSESSLGTLTTELKSGTLSGIVMSRDSAAGYVKKSPSTYAVSKIKLKSPANTGNRVALRKSDKALRKEVNKVITHDQKTGRMQKLFNKAVDMQVKNNK